MKDKKIINVQIGERIRNSRELAGYTQEKLADTIGVSIQYISDLERGVVGTSVPTLIKICEILSVSSDYILMGRNEKNDVTRIIDRFSYLDEEQIKILESAINNIMDAFEYQKKDNK